MTDAEILRHRAAQLARRPVAAPAAGAMQALDFDAAGQPCLLELECLREVRAQPELMPLPLASPALLGLVSWRGGMLPVLDLARLLALPAADAAAPRRLLLLGRRHPRLALAVNAVRGLQPVAADAVDRRSQPLEGLRPDIVRGVTDDGHLLLDGPRLLALRVPAGP